MNKQNKNIIKFGRWESIFDEDEFKCSECGKEVLYPFTRKIKKCPQCGAIMVDVCEWINVCEWIKTEVSEE